MLFLIIRFYSLINMISKRAVDAFQEYLTVNPLVIIERGGNGEVQPQLWHGPSEGFFKINVDGAWK